MALMVPPVFPHDLTQKRKLVGEALVFTALRTSLDDAWCVFYDRPIRGSRRRIDFLGVHSGRGVLAIEVKGGMVHDKRGAFRQRIGKSGQPKKIDPFGQLKCGLRDLFLAGGITDHAVPMHQAIWFPEMGQGGLRWTESDHILTRETLDPVALAAVVERAMPAIPEQRCDFACERIIGVLS